MTATTPDDVRLQELAAERHADLTRSVARLRTRSGDLDRWLLIIGGALMPLGVLIIFLGWWGVSHKAALYSQLSYLASGGLIGLALVIAGGFTYFAYWLTRLVREGREQSARATEALERLEQLLAGGIVTVGGDGEEAAAPARATARATATAKKRRSPRKTFVATSTGTMFHRPDCPVVAYRDGLVRVGADESGYTPCKICQPLEE